MSFSCRHHGIMCLNRVYPGKALSPKCSQLLRLYRKVENCAIFIFFFSHFAVTETHVFVNSKNQTAQHCFLLALIFCLKPSTAPFTTWCQPGGIQSQKWYHEWCIRWKNAFTLASTQRAVVANTVMEKYEGYSAESALWNQESIYECCLI